MAKMTYCTRCKKRIAVVFMQKLDENGNTTQEGYCIKCAREMGIKPINDFFEKMGINEEELDAMESEMSGMLENGMFPMDMGLGGESEDDEDSDDDEGGRAPSINLGSIFGNMGKQSGESEEEESEEASTGEAKEKKKKKKGRKNLEAFCVNLTDKAKRGEIDRVIGRDRELERIMQILCRRQKNNPCLIGEPGVGKTAVAEALALKIANNDVPSKLRGKEVYLVDMTAVVAGTQFRGQFENRMKGLIEEVRKLGNIILVIDEIHSIVSAGNAEGGMNAGNILKPALSRGEIQVIGATTLAEYRKYIEKDAALERRFQPVMINEPSIADTIKILEGIKSYYEDFHKVQIPTETVEKAVVYSERYITDRFLPDKAIDLIDEAASYLSINDISIEKCESLGLELSEIKLERELIESSEHTEEEQMDVFRRLAELKARELEVTKEYEKFEEAAKTVTLLPEHLSHCIEIWTGIPASSINESEYIRIDKLEERLKKRIVGQDKAISVAAKAIKRSRAGIAAKRKPCSFIFAGPTGVGKTELVKTIANDLFDSPEALIRLDMSEFMEKHAVSRIIGAPPGYVGFEEAGQLTEKIRRRPYSVVLFDEIEKAHPDVLNILLQILDDGKITDAQGREVNFENTMLVLTTNAGSSTGMNSIGFSEKEGSIAGDRIMNALSEFLRPEFINRIDEIIVFNQLTEENFKDIARIMLDDLKSSLAEKSISFVYDESALEFIAKNSYSRKFGARNLRRFIQTEIEDKAAEIIISKYDAKIRGLYVSSENERLNVVELNA
ncbi:MAG: ATP-dependent Clp protease ATP-binding subunit [Clostridia bacterium]|nr:ATP-dependent Clp protease ATP-binding subunit [Clostridia bacterium]